MNVCVACNSAVFVFVLVWGVEFLHVCMSGVVLLSLSSLLSLLAVLFVCGTCVFLLILSVCFIYFVFR